MLPNRPSLNQVANEFGSETRADLVNPNSMRNFYVAVFGGVTSGVSRLSDFGNTGQPTANPDLADSPTNPTPGEGWTIENPTDNLLRISHNNVTAGGVISTISGEFQSRFDENMNEIIDPDPEQWQQFALATYTDQDSEPTAQAFVDPGGYFVRGSVFNGYNSNVANRIYGDFDRVNVDFTPPPPDEFLSVIISDCFVDSGSTVFAEWDDNQSTLPSEYEAQIRINEGAWEDATLDTLAGGSTNWGQTDNPKSAFFNLPLAPPFNPGDVIDIRVRAAAEGGINAAEWSDFCRSIA